MVMLSVLYIYFTQDRELRSACRVGDIPRVKYLIQQEADPNAKDSVSLLPSYNI